tara:strand:- start:1767 stop:1964 length:198 start_codon:yes stop_codon:yes gene_type:complete
MKVIGYLLVGLGFLDLILSWTIGSPIDPIVGPTIAPFTAWILIGVGYFIEKIGEDSGDEDQENNL